MKVGIMSMQRIKNYGSFLQAYGLKRIIEELGHEVVFVDYRVDPPVIKEKHSFFYKCKLKAYEIKLLIMGLILGKNKVVNIEYSYNDYLAELGVENKRTENIPVDVLVIGSDEVFNCLQGDNVGYSKQLFGEGVSAKKVISYAASCGYTNVEGLEKYGIREEVAQMLKNNFASISVRDYNAENVVKELTGRTPEINVDPVLVADYEDKIIRKGELSDYIIIYAYWNRINDEKEIEAIKDFAQKRNLKTVSIGAHQDWTDIKINANPFELLGYFCNAEYVITDTFHGTIFSMITKRKFATIVRNKTEKSQYSNAEKLTSLLSQFGLKDRIAGDMSKLEEILEKEINYEEVDKTREIERQKTIKYLKNNISV